jgi:HAE1 family hydrophobic/amphiphilic exporter-1
VEEGKRRYLVRAEGDLDTPEAVRAVVLRTQSDGATGRIGRVTVGDIAEVSYGYSEPRARIRRLGRSAVVMNAKREAGANVIETMEGVRAAVAELNEAVLPGEGLVMEQVYDETDYIHQSRSLVINNIFIGGALAIGVLLLFLGSLSSVMVIGVAIPVTVVSTFILIFVLDRSINIISLAGMAFAVGMVVDNSVVVLENIFRHREMGKSKWDAAVDGAQEVWGAVLASTLTTLAVFVPVVFVQDESGQLFRDIAIAISVAVALSLVVSISVVPMLSSRILSGSGKISPLTHFFRILGVYALGRLCRRIYVGVLSWLLRGVVRRLFVATGITAGAVALAVMFFPPIDYLPKGNRNLIFAFMRTPPGLNLDEMDRIVRILETRLDRVEEIDRFFAVARAQNPIIGMIAKKEYSDLASMRRLVRKLFGMMQGIPGVRAFVTQASLFRRRGSGFIGGINLQVDITGDSLSEIQRIAADVGARSRGLGGVRFVNSSFDLGNPELQVHVDRQKTAEFGLSVTELGSVVETLVNGTKAGIFRDRGEELDIVLRGPPSDFTRTQRIEELKVHTPEGQVVSLGDIARVRAALGPTKVEHIDRDRSVSLTVNIGEELPLQDAIDKMKREVITPMRQTLPLGYSVDVSGRAKDLERTWASLQWSLVLAVLITYLLMAALFEAWSYPLIIMFSVPFAATGGVLMVSFMNSIEPSVKMDTLTMLGFIILTGIVVNNAILLVHQALNHFRAGLPMREAILESARDRMRPIFMTTTTTVLGMLPLVLASGAGSELYRGLGSAVLGGLAMSTIFTLLLIPVVFSLWVDFLAFIRPASFAAAAAAPSGAIGAPSERVRPRKTINLIEEED